MNNPNISGPLTGGKHGWPFAASMLDIKAMGYVEEEYVLSGNATCYRDIDNSTARRDGHWQVEAAGEAPYRTRILIYRPADAAQFNGSVVLTWNNVTAGYDLFGADSRELFEGGFALACLTTQKVGIEGLPPVNQGLKGWDPDRYGDLSIPSDDYAYDIFTQAASAVRDPALLGGLAVNKVVGWGASQSAGRLATYLNAIQPLTGALDGLILAIYFGSGSPIEVGDAVVNINEPAVDRSPQLTGRNLLRDDLGIPVFVINSELEAIACHGVRQPDSDTFRYWESAGTCHVSQQVQAARQRMHERDQVVGRPPDPDINRIPMALLYDPVFHHMQRWLVDGVQPPRQPLIEFSGDPAQVVRDEDGIAVGGIRLPQVTVPIATNSAIPRGEGILALLGGSSDPFSAAQLTARYGSQSDFLRAFRDAAEAAVNEGVLMARDVEPLLDEAAASWQA